MSRISETPNNVLETYDWQDVAEDLQEKLDIALKENKQLEDLLNKANDEVVSYCNCCIDLQQRIDKATDYIQNNQLVFELSSKKQISSWFVMFYRDLLAILEIKNE